MLTQGWLLMGVVVSRPVPELGRETGRCLEAGGMNIMDEYSIKWLIQFRKKKSHCPMTPGKMQCF